jgi:hypothetical protein
MEQEEGVHCTHDSRVDINSRNDSWLEEEALGLRRPTSADKACAVRSGVGEKLLDLEKLRLAHHRLQLSAPHAAPALLGIDVCQRRGSERHRGKSSLECGEKPGLERVLYNQPRIYHRSSNHERQTRSPAVIIVKPSQPRDTAQCRTYVLCRSARRW